MTDTPKKIVIVEDDVALAEIYQTLLSSNGFDVSVAHDGKAGLELIKEVLPDLALLDIMMPELSGDMVLYEMRTDIKTKDIKVIMLTNLSETEAPENLDKLHFSRYIVKASLDSTQLPTICAEVIAETNDEGAAHIAL